MAAGCGLKNMVSQQDDEEMLKERAFVDLASRCQAVICCRVTPKQKAIVVQLVKRHQKATTLAIGDGANDVNMIKTADIGVGISGQEGTQAVQSSDYALAQFSYLQRLLLVHGRWSYLRICKFLRYFYYKTFASVLGHVWFACFSGFTALMVYDSWFIAFYAVLFTAFPVLSMGLLEQDVNAKMSLKFPQLYKAGQVGSLFSYRTFCWSIFQGITTSLATFFIPYGAFLDTAGPNVASDYQSFTVTTATAGILAVTLEIVFDISYWTVASFLALLLSTALYFLVSLFTQSYPLFKAAPFLFRFPDANKNALSKLHTWLVILLAVGVSLLPSLICRFFERITSADMVQEKEDPYKDRTVEKNTVELNSHFTRNSTLRRSTYAFSQGEGYGDLISRGTSIRKKKVENPGTPAESEPALPSSNP